MRPEDAEEERGGKGRRGKQRGGKGRRGKAGMGGWHYTNGFCWNTARRASNVATRLLDDSFQECRQLAARGVGVIEVKGRLKAKGKMRKQQTKGRDDEVGAGYGR
jgi:hypothetical protein